MRVADFDFDLPESLIAQSPLEERTAARLLCLDRQTGCRLDRVVRDLPDLLRPGDCLVLNDTRVIKARLYARKPSGGRVEILIERVTGKRCADAWIRASRPVKTPSRLSVEDVEDVEVTVSGMTACPGQPALYRLAFSSPVDEVLAAHGHVPLPPYIRRGDDHRDEERYQTVFATRPGAVAAPTAGLHFDRALMTRLREIGVDPAFVTLHVGAGTFRPLREGDVEDQNLHPEVARMDEEVCRRIEECKHRGGRVIAVGTTCVRTLESAAAAGSLAPFEGETELFIRPGYRFRIVDALITNFHLPRSSLLMLVCAFAGTSNVLAAYRHAVREGYRFYSYGDAMLLTDGIGEL